MKKIISITMTLVLVTVLLTACSKDVMNDTSKDTGTKENTTVTESPVATEAPEPTVAAEPTAAAVGIELPDTLENPNVTILWHTSQDQFKTNLEANPATFDAVWSVKEAFEQKYGGTVTVIDVPWGDQRDTLINKVNAGEALDLAQANDQNFPIYPAKKLVQDVTQYLDINDSFWNKGVTKTFTYGGVSFAAGVDATPIVCYYNKELFESNSIKTPMEYFKEGNWTWDTFREVALAMTGDSDGDSVVDSFGFGWWDSAYVPFLATNGITGVAYNADGTIGSNYMTPQAIETMTFLQNAFVNDKYMDATQTGDYFINMFKMGKLAMAFEYGFGGYTVYASDYEIAWAPLPTGPSGKELQGGGGMSGWCIPITSTNGDGAAAFMKFSSQMLMEYNTITTVEKYGQENVDLMNLLAQNIVYAPIGIEGYWDANWTIYQGTILGTPVSTFMKTADEQIIAGAKVTLEQ